MKKILAKIIFSGLLLPLTVSPALAQDINPVNTAVPSLTIAPDARAGGMGDAGVATAPDVYSQYWNPAKYAFESSRSGVAFSYTPWLRKVTDDIALMNVVGFYKFGKNDNQALSASIRYFSVGDIDIRNTEGVLLGNVAPHEMAIDLGYSRKLTETLSGAVAIRYIRSDYSKMDTETSTGSTFAADIAIYNESYVNIGASESLLSFGANISNIGGKIKIGDGTDFFIPTNMKLGASILHPIDDKNTISLSVDMNKLLVPTPPDRTKDDYQKKYKDYVNRSSISGIFKSFGDAPGGFSEEMKEIMWSGGLEYSYDAKFKIRTGYCHENKMKGNRQYFTFGAGVKVSAFQFDAAYVVSTIQSNPLDQTFRLSLAFDIDKMKDLF